MSITNVLNDKDLSPADKLDRIAETVSVARKAYGNEEAEIKAPKVQTPYGAMGFDSLDSDSKVEVLKGQLAELKARAVEAAEQDTAVNVNKRIEELLATNGFFANIKSGTKFEYI